MTYDCMTPEELALWMEQTARNRQTVPCYDCPAWFRSQEQAAGRCNRVSSPVRLEQMRTYHLRRREVAA